MSNKEKMDARARVRVRRMGKKREEEGMNDESSFIDICWLGRLCVYEYEYVWIMFEWKVDWLSSCASL